MKDCFDCKHSDKRPAEWPCKDCCEGDRFEPIEGGDILLQIVPLIKDELYSVTTVQNMTRAEIKEKYGVEPIEEGK
jgi:hypothetical protein